MSLIWHCFLLAKQVFIYNLEFCI